MSAPLPTTWNDRPSAERPLDDPRRLPGVPGLLAEFQLVANANVLCLLSTSGANRLDDVAATLARLDAAATIVGARLWVQCFDTEPRGRVRRSSGILESIRGTPLEGDGHDRRIGLFLSGQGGDDLRRSVPTALRAADPLPDGQTVDRLLVAYDGLDSAVTPTVHGQRSIPTTYLVYQQDSSVDRDLEQRQQYAQREMKWATVLPETQLVVALEQHALRATMDALPTSATVAPRPRGRL